MKFAECNIVEIDYLRTVDGIQYRCNANGENWERLYGESWESVYFDEENACKQAWMDYWSRVES